MRLSRAAIATAGVAAAVAAHRRRRPEDDLAGEVALVTGASRGLGLLIATELAGRGCRLLLCARDGAELERAADRLRSADAEVAAVACDVTREESAGELVDAACERYGRLDILVSNAGVIREAQGSGNCWSARCGTRCLASRRRLRECRRALCALDWTVLWPTSVTAGTGGCR